MGQASTDSVTGPRPGNAKVVLLGAASLIVLVVAGALVTAGVASGEVAATLLFLPVFGAGFLGGRTAGYLAAVGATVVYVALRREDMTSAGVAASGVLALTRALAYLLAGHVGALAVTLVPGGDAGAAVGSARSGRPAAGAGRPAAGAPRRGEPAWGQPWDADRTQAQPAATAEMRQPALAGVGGGPASSRPLAGDERYGAPPSSMTTTSMSNSWPPEQPRDQWRGDPPPRPSPGGDDTGGWDDGGWGGDDGWGADGQGGAPPASWQAGDETRPLADDSWAAVQQSWRRQHGVPVEDDEQDADDGWPQQQAHAGPGGGDAWGPAAPGPGDPWGAPSEPAPGGPWGAPDDQAQTGGWGGRPDQAADPWGRPAEQQPADPWGRPGEQQAADPWSNGAEQPPGGPWGAPDEQGPGPQARGGEPGPGGGWGAPPEQAPADPWAQPGPPAGDDGWGTPDDPWGASAPTGGTWPTSPAPGPGAGAGWQGAPPEAAGAWSPPAADDWAGAGPSTNGDGWDSAPAADDWAGAGPSSNGDRWDDAPPADDWSSTGQQQVVWDDPAAAGHGYAADDWSSTGQHAAVPPVPARRPEPAPVDLPAVDPETGLWTAKFLRDRLTDERSRSRRSGHPFSLVLVQVPDGPLAQLPYRRQVTLLRELGYQFVAGGLVEHLVHVPDQAQHWFAVILPDTDRSGAQVLERRLRLGIGGYLSSRGLRLRELESASLTAPDDDPAMGTIWEALIGPDDGDPSQQYGY